MTRHEGNGVFVMLSLLGGIGRRSTREEIRPYVDGLSDEALADVLTARAAALLAEDGGGDLLLESAAARLRGRDVERFGSGAHEKKEKRRK